MSNNPPRGVSLLFSFQDIVQAREFHDLAFRNINTTNVQYPLANDGSGRRILNRVLVIGTGSFVFDTLLENQMMTEAKRLGGVLLPKDCSF